MITLKLFQKKKAKDLSNKIFRTNQASQMKKKVIGHKNIFFMYLPNLGKSFVIISTIIKTIESENALGGKKSVWIWVTKNHPIKHYFRNNHIKYSLFQNKILCLFNQKINKLFDHTVYLFDIENESNWKKLANQSIFKKKAQNIVLIFDLNYRKNNIFPKNAKKMAKLIKKMHPSVILNVIQQDWSQSDFDINIINEKKQLEIVSKDKISKYPYVKIDANDNMWENSSELIRSETVIVDKNNLLSDNQIKISSIKENLHAYHINRFLVSEGIRRLNDLKKKYQEISSEINPLMIVAFPNEEVDYQDEIIDLLEKKEKKKKINCIANDLKKNPDDLKENHDMKVNSILKIFKDHPVDCIITNEKRLKLWDCSRAQVIVRISEIPSSKNKNILEQQNIAKLITEPTRGFYENEDLNKAYYYFWHPDIEKWHLSNKEYQECLEPQIVNNEPQLKKKYNASFIWLIFLLFLGFYQLLIFIVVLNNWWEY